MGKTRSKSTQAAESDNVKLFNEASSLQDAALGRYLQASEPEQYKLYSLGKLLQQGKTAEAEAFATSANVLEHFRGWEGSKLAQEGQDAAQSDLGAASSKFADAEKKFFAAATIAMEKARNSKDDKSILESAESAAKWAESAEKCAGAVKQIAQMQAQQAQQATQQADAMAKAMDASLSKLRKEKGSKGT